MFAKGGWGRKALYVSGTLAGVGVGGGYMAYQQRLKANRSVTAEQYNARQDQTQLAYALAHVCDNAASTLTTRFYRYTTCPWCGTVKAFLDHANIAHECVEVDPMIKRELAESDYKKVPQLRFDLDGKPGPYLVDSRIIVDTLAKCLGYEAQLSDTAVLQWRRWAREPLVRLITLEFNRSLIDAWRGYSYIDACDTIPYINKLFLKVVGAPVMYMVAMRITRPKLIKDGYLTETDVPKTRLHEELNRFVREALVDARTHKPQPFHGGSKPDLVDLDVFGVLQSVRGHRVYNEIISETQLMPWLQAMDKATRHAPYVATT